MGIVYFEVRMGGNEMKEQADEMWKFPPKSFEILVLDIPVVAEIGVSVVHGSLEISNCLTCQFY